MRKILLFAVIALSITSCVSNTVKIDLSTDIYVGEYGFSRITTTFDLVSDSIMHIHILGVVKDMQSNLAVEDAIITIKCASQEIARINSDDKGQFDLESSLNIRKEEPSYMAIVVEKIGSKTEFLTYFEHDKEVWCKCGINNPESYKAAVAQVIELRDGKIGKYINSTILISKEN